jgi:hypothetical protein
VACRLAFGPGWHQGTWVGLRDELESYWTSLPAFGWWWKKAHFRFNRSSATVAHDFSICSDFAVHFDIDKHIQQTFFRILLERFRVDSIFFLFEYWVLLSIQLWRPATLTSCVELYFSYSLSQFWEEACRDKLNDVIQVISKWFPVRYLDFDTFVESGMRISWWSSTGRCWLRKKLRLPEQKPEININKELSHTILGVNLRNLS